MLSISQSDLHQRHQILWEIFAYKIIYLFMWSSKSLQELSSLTSSTTNLGVPRYFSDKESTCQFRSWGRHVFNPRVWKIPWRRVWQPTLVFFPGRIPMDRGTWQAIVHRVAESQTHLQWLSMSTQEHINNLIAASPCSSNDSDTGLPLTPRKQPSALFQGFKLAPLHIKCC